MARRGRLLRERNLRSSLLQVVVPVLLAAQAAWAAPELLVNGRGEEQPEHGWFITGGYASATGLMRDPQGSLLTPDEGLGFFVLGPGGFPALTQTGTFPTAAERLVIRGRVRTNATGTMIVRLRARNSAGNVVTERTMAANSATGWQTITATFEIIGSARTWEVSLIGVFPGGLGIHADAFLLVPTCLADINGDRLVNFFDLSEFLARYGTQDPEADLDRNGSWDFFDISTYLDWFGSFCE